MTAEQEILQVFERRGTSALFVSELQHGVGPAADPQRFSSALERLAARGDILIVAKPAPDPHLADADLRIAAAVASAEPRAAAESAAAAAAESAWSDWLRDFLSSHRCS